MTSLAERGSFAAVQRVLLAVIIFTPALATHLLAQATADADEPVGPVGLDVVVVTATRAAGRAFDLPYTTHVVDDDDIRERRAFRNLPEALREVPGVYVQKTSYGQGSPFIRGFTGFRTLLLIDGIRLNNAVFRDGPNQYWATVDPLTVERLELVKGPGSVLYGSDAVGGTVNAITHAATIEPGGPAARPGLYYRYASGESSSIVRGEGAAGDGARVAARGGVSWKDFRDLEAGGDTGDLANTAYDELDGDFKLTIAPRADLELVMAFQRVEQDDVPRTHATIFSKSFHGTTVGTELRLDEDQRRTLGYAQVHWTPDPGWVSAASFSLSYHLQEENQDRIRANGIRRREGFEDATVGTWLQLQSPTPLGTLAYGAEYYHDEIDSFFAEFQPDGGVSSRRPRGPVADDASYDLLGVYLQDAFEPLPRLEVTLGGRFNFAHAGADQVDDDPAIAPELDSLSESYTALVGSLRAVYRLTDGWNLFGGVSQAFRAPNLSDLTRLEMNPASGEFEVPSPNLDPEEFLAVEAGTRLRWRAVEAFASYYYTFIDGLIVRYPTGRIVGGGPEFSKANVGDGFVQGVEVGGAWRFYPGWRTFASFAWVEGESDTFVGSEKHREPLSRIQPPVGMVGLGWAAASGRFWAEATAMFAGDQDRLSSRDKADTQRIPPDGTPGYEVYALRGGLRVTPRLSLFAAIENLGDRDYRTHGSGSNESGLNVIAGAQWSL